MLCSRRRAPPWAAILALVGAGLLAAFVQPLGASAAPGLEELKLLNETGRAAEAEAAARALLAETERITGPGSVETAEVLDQLAVALRRGGKFGEPEAKEVCERALRIKDGTIGAEDARYAVSLHNLGLLYYMRGGLDSASTHLDRALRVRERTLGADHLDVAQSLLAVGSVDAQRGKLAAARAAVERAVAIQRSSLRAVDPARAWGLNVLGGLAYQAGALSDAIPPLEEAITLWERSSTPNRPMLADCHQKLGCVSSGMGDREAALREFRSALALWEESLGPDHPLVASVLKALAEEMAGAGDIRGAQSRYQRALRIEERVYGADHSKVGWTRMKLGQLCLVTRDLERARAMLRRALEIQENALGRDHPDLWLTLLGLAEVAEGDGNPAGARDYYERTLRILENAYGPSNIDVGSALNQYARFLLEVRDSAAALEVSLRAARVNEEQFRLISRGLAERQALLYASVLNSSLDVGLAVLTGDRYRSDPAKIREVWDVLVRRRALVLDEIASRNRSAGVTEGVAGAARRVEAARQRLANLLVRGPGGESLGRYRALTDSTRGELERAERELGAASAASRAGQTQSRAGLPEVFSAVPQDAALVAFTCHGTASQRSYLALVLTSDRRVLAIPLGPSNEIEGLVSDWRARVAVAPSGAARNIRIAEQACRAAGERLRSRIWDPLAPHLQNAGRVFVVPDGSLHLVNLAALPVGTSEYLVEVGPLLHDLSAERDLVRLSGRRPAGGGLLALGGPSFDREAQRSTADSPATARERPRGEAGGAKTASRSAPPGCVEFRSTRFEPLPETVKEVEEIAAVWEKAAEALVLTGPGATERAFKALAPGRKVIHVATHGFFLNGRCGRSSRPGSTPTRGIGGISVARPPAASPTADENPLRLSGVALAGANRRASAGPGEEDGILTAEEISSLDLSRAEWAVLSACDTGVGEVQTGEGVLGLRRAFQAAGAGTLIMSLWAVEDHSAREWMKSLYVARFRRNMGTAEAVREASRGMLLERRARAASTHPFYWAGFVAAGDWE